MFKLVVLFAVAAAAVAEPGAIFATPLIAPYTYSSTLISPASTTISRSASSVVHPSPAYVAPYLAHYLKKRSATFLAAPYVAAPYVSAPIVTPIVRAPLYHAPIAAPIAYSPLHLIKKRSAPLLTTPYISTVPFPAPFLSTYSYAPAVLPATPVIAPAPLTYTHLIKKRSAPLIPLGTTYIGGAAVSHQSRVDIEHSPSLIATSYHAPLVYPSRIFLGK